MDIVCIHIFIWPKGAVNSTGSVHTFVYACMILVTNRLDYNRLTNRVSGDSTKIYKRRKDEDSTKIDEQSKDEV